MLLDAQPDIHVIGEAGNGREAIDLAHIIHPDVVIMDLGMPVLDGVAATKLLTEERAESTNEPVTKILVLTTFNEDEAVYNALRAGASGFLLKYAAPADLVSAVRSVAAGDGWIDPSVAVKVIDALARRPRNGQQADDLVRCLTARETEVLILMARGLSNQEIKASLFLSEATVKTHVARIIMKTGSRDRTQAVVLAFRSGLVTPDDH